LVLSWKIGDKDYHDGQTLQYRLLSTKWSKWTALTVGTGTTKRSLVLDMSVYYPTTKKILAKVQFRVRGKRRAADGKTYSVSEWAVKDYDIQLPNAPTLSQELNSTDNNKCTFTWKTTVATDVAKWFTNTEVQTVLAESSNVTDGAQIKGWQAHLVSSANGSTTITEDTSVINLGTSYTRWVRIRSRGPQGNTAWKYIRHVYAIPYQTKNVIANASIREAGGYLCRADWKTPRDASHPVDAINVQYTFANPETGMTCPDGASWTDAQTLAYKDGSDAAAFSIDNIVGTDQCLFVRINTVHDRNTT
jgi:hypothetical protein